MVCVQIPTVHVHNAKDGIKRFNYKDCEQAELADYFALSKNEERPLCFSLEQQACFTQRDSVYLGFDYIHMRKMSSSGIWK